MDEQIKEQEVTEEAAKEPSLPQKEKKSFGAFLKKHRKALIVIAVIVALLIATYFIVLNVLSAVFTAKATEYLDGKYFIHHSDKYGKYEIFSFKDGKMSIESWGLDGYTYADINEYKDYKIKVGGITSKFHLFLTFDGSNKFITFNDLGEVCYTPYGINWQLTTEENISALRKQVLCVHDFRESVVKSSTCTSNGINRKTCAICGVTEEYTTYAKHEYDSRGKCTICGDRKPQEQVDIQPNTWYSYSGLSFLKVQNCLVVDTRLESNCVSVFYYGVCSHCHTACNTVFVLNVGYDKPYYNSYTCLECGKDTRIAMETSN